MNAGPSTELLHLATTLYRRGHNDAEVSEQLKEKGAGESMLKEIIAQVKFLLQARKRKTGIFCCGTGIFLLVAGCILAMILYTNGTNIRFALYGLTTIGVGFTLKGMIDLLGW